MKEGYLMKQTSSFQVSCWTKFMLSHKNMAHVCTTECGKKKLGNGVSAMLQFQAGKAFWCHNLRSWAKQGPKSNPLPLCHSLQWCVTPPPNWHATPPRLQQGNTAANDLAFVASFLFLNYCFWQHQCCCSFQRWKRKYFKLKRQKLYYAKDNKVSNSFVVQWLACSYSARADKVCVLICL